MTRRAGSSAQDPATVLKKFIDANTSAMAEDRDGAPVFLARNGLDT